MNKVLYSFFLVIFFIASFISCNNANDASKISIANDTATLIKRGEYLVQIMGCDDCHSPKKMGNFGPEIIPELRLSGFQASASLPPLDTTNIKNGWALFSPDLTMAIGPWGKSFSGNITSHETGIGNWSFEQFKLCLTQGKYKGLANSRNLLPPMPWMNYKNMQEDDLLAIYQFLKSTKPVDNVVTSSVVAVK
jgi:hypothetical protein